MPVQNVLLVSELDLNDEDIIRVSKVIGAAFNEIPNAEVKWKEFGMKLLLKDDDNVLGDIKKVCKGGFADRCQKLLDYWKSVKAREGEGWNRVSEALRAVGLTGPADKLEKDLKSLKQKTPEQPSQYEPGQAYEGKLQL